MRLSTVASAVGMLTGAWVVGGSFADGIGKACYYGVPCPSGGMANIYVVALSVLLFLNSLVTLIGPRIAFYASAVLSVFLGISMVPNSSFNNPVVLVAIVLVAMTFALSVVGARKRTQISEQSNPMNLPVFG
jgi:hypothetical protein